MFGIVPCHQRIPLLSILVCFIGCQEYDTSLLRYSDAAVDGTLDGSGWDASDASDASDANDASNLDVISDGDGNTSDAKDASQEAPVDALGDTENPCTETQVDCDGDESNGCETNLLTDKENCGACGRTCLGGECEEGVCAPFLLAPGQSMPTNVALDATHLYWTNQVANGAVMRIPRLGGNLEVVASFENPPGGLAIDNDAVYWSEFASPGTVWRLDKTDIGDSSAAIALATNQGASLYVAVDTSRVYWTTSTTVRGVSKSGGSVVQYASGQNMVGGLVASISDIFWTQVMGGSVMGRPIQDLDAGVREIASNQSAPAGLTADLGYLYWANHLGNADGGTPSIMTIARTGIQTPEVLADQQVGPVGVALFGTHVFWTDVNGGTVMRVPKAGGTVEQLASGQQAPGGIAVDVDAVYWANRDGGSIMAVAR